MMQAMRANLKTIQAKSASTLLCTFASSVLIPAALHYTESYTNLLLVLVISIVWILSLARMWMDVIDSVYRRFDARVEWARTISVKAASSARARPAVPRQTMPSISKSAELLAAYRMGSQVLIPGTAPAPVSHPVGA